ncbi:beta-N-acetylhexosaminidase [Methylovirgula sp. 4M-Z18]|uniref:beta-N-acetylhexosaminidase n=1 Tax=Methylovirgula sp. 4M-Z18 TaxID=2293567 RepID=UPI000E2ED981|nr:beta-N-acetylhexosaminidase [Methylovirgula sp. 4M-Z18]RFB81038.1 beta-N-acetylhexosaminidase [Methylovirgula sp. 4M-Z18]
MASRAFICGVTGHEMTSDEKAFIRESQPWGLILFKRNVDTPDQVKRLTDTFREIVGRDAPVLIDQEGGRVQRMGPPHWPTYPAAARFFALKGDIWGKREAVRLAARLMAHDLLQCGINVDCMPVLDVQTAGTHSAIGDRTYAPDGETVGILGRAAAEGLLAGNVLPVMKHIPGHGRATVDSHMELPVVIAKVAELAGSDFLPFRMLNDLPAAMTAHVVYTAIDKTNPATTSRKVLRTIVRGEIGFGGLILSDDMSMHALTGPFRARGEAALKAGCDIALHCNGNLAEASGVAEAAPLLKGESLRRAEAALARIRHAAEPIDPVDGHARLKSLLANQN